MIIFEAAGPLAEESGEALAVPVFAERSWGPGADWVAEALGSWLDGYLDELDFTGKANEIALLPTGGKLPYETLFLVGLGEEADLEGVQTGGRMAGLRGHPDCRSGHHLPRSLN